MGAEICNRQAQQSSFDSGSPLEPPQLSKPSQPEPCDDQDDQVFIAEQHKSNILKLPRSKISTQDCSNLQPSEPSGIMIKQYRSRSAMVIEQPPPNQGQSINKTSGPSYLRRNGHTFEINQPSKIFLERIHEDLENSEGIQVPQYLWDKQLAMWQSQNERPEVSEVENRQGVTVSEDLKNANRQK